MKEQKFFQEVILDTTDILSGEYLKDADVKQSLKDFLMEGYNPFIDKLAQLYSENPNLSAKDSRVVEISAKLKEMIKDSGKNYESELEGSRNSNKAMSTQLSYIAQDIDNDKPIKEILESVAERLQKQTEKDFEENRMHPILIDQNGKEFHLDGNPDFHEAISKRAEKNFKDTFKEALKLTDAQYNCLLCRFNQRALEGSSMALVYNEKFFLRAQERQNIFYIKVEEEKDAEGKTTARKILGTTAVENISFLEGMKEDDDDFHKIAITKYKIDLDLPESKAHLALPIHKTKETFSYQALDENAIYEIPEILKKRTENNKLISSKKILSNEEIVKLVKTPGIKEELTSDNNDKLVAQVNYDVIKALINHELKKLRKEDGNQKNNVIAKKIQENLSKNFSISKIKEDHDFGNLIAKFVEQKDPTLLTKIANFTRATFKHRKSLAEYNKYKQLKTENRVIDKLIEYHQELLDKKPQKSISR